MKTIIKVLAFMLIAFSITSCISTIFTAKAMSDSHKAQQKYKVKAVEGQIYVLRNTLPTYQSPLDTVIIVGIDKNNIRYAPHKDSTRVGNMSPDAFGIRYRALEN